MQLICGRFGKGGFSTSGEGIGFLFFIFFMPMDAKETQPA
jgi:hypothetical protein